MSAVFLCVGRGNRGAAEKIKSGKVFRFGRRIIRRRADRLKTRHTGMAVEMCRADDPGSKQTKRQSCPMGGSAFLPRQGRFCRVCPPSRPMCPAGYGGDFGEQRWERKEKPYAIVAKSVFCGGDGDDNRRFSLRLPPGGRRNRQPSGIVGTAVDDDFRAVAAVGYDIGNRHANQYTQQRIIGKRPVGRG